MVEHKNTRRLRLYILFAVPLLIFILSIRTLFILQIGREGNALRQIAKKQYFSEIPLPAQRGIIYDRNKRPITLNIERAQVYQHENLDRKTYETLKRYGLHPVKKFKGITKIGYINPLYVDSINMLNKIYTKKHHSGKNYILSIHKYWARQTVIEEGYSSLIGYVGEKHIGIFGIEKALDVYLRGKDGTLPCIKSAGKYIREKFFTIDRERIDPTSGKSVILAIDAYLQEISYAALKEKVDALSAKGGFVIITDPRTGEVLSMVSYPVKNSKNFATLYPYEPGSTFKLVVYSAALDDKLISPFDSIDTEDGKLTVLDKTISDVHKMGKITWLSAFSHSSNVAAAKLALKLGRKRVYEQILKLGFGSPTGSFLGEECMPPGDYKKWKKSKLAILGIGYGILVNGLQVAMAYGAVANGGYLYSPSFLANSSPLLVRKSLGKRSVKFLRLFMKSVVEEGTGKKAKVEGVTIYGKTGTALVYDKIKHRYDQGRRVVSFIGFFPEEPEYLIYVVIFEPKGEIWTLYGGEIAAPVFKKIAENIMWRRFHENI